MRFLLELGLLFFSLWVLVMGKRV